MILEKVMEKDKVIDHIRMELMHEELKPDLENCSGWQFAGKEKKNMQKEE